jgi:hypothetical protein
MGSSMVLSPFEGLVSSPGVFRLLGQPPSNASGLRLSTTLRVCRGETPASDDDRRRALAWVTRKSSDLAGFDGAAAWLGRTFRCACLHR